MKNKKKKSYDWIIVVIIAILFGIATYFKIEWLFWGTVITSGLIYILDSIIPHKRTKD